MPCPRPATIFYPLGHPPPPPSPTKSFLPFAQVALRPCLLATPMDACALAQLPHLTCLELGTYSAGDVASATRVAGGWRLSCHSRHQPGVMAALARSFSCAAAPAGQQQQQPQQLAAEAEAGQRSMFRALVMVGLGGPSPHQVSEFASLGRALAAFDDVELRLGWEGQQACPASVRALAAPVAARLVGLTLWATSSADVALGALQGLAFPRLTTLELFDMRDDDCPLGIVTAVASLDAPRLTCIILPTPVAGSRAAVAAAVTALAVGRPQPVGPDGRPAGLIVEVSEELLSDEELGSVREAVAAVRRPGCVELVGGWSRFRYDY
jgi:hypothetical protein